jgi:hypothetical protein
LDGNPQTLPFLISKDFAKQIQSDNLNQVIGGDATILAAAQLQAIEEATSYLIQKYDLTNEFQNIYPWSNANIYAASNRVYLDAPAYIIATAYTAGQYTTYLGNFYLCTASTTGAFAPGSWTLIAPQFSIYNAQYPQPPFDYNNQYTVGTQVFWMGKVYTCLIATKLLSQDNALQYSSLQNLPLLNIAPDNVNSGAQYWGAGTAYSVPASTLITNVAYWTPGDNRSQQMVATIVDITLYHVHSRIAPRNIPELRIDRYHHAIDWLEKAAKGTITAALPLLKPRQGARIRYGGQIKNSNSY